MSVFQNPHMAGRTGFGHAARPMRGGMARRDTFGDGVRQAIQQPAGMQMAPARQAFSAYGAPRQSYQPQSMAPARQDFSAYSTPPAMPQQAAQPAPQPKVTQTTVVNKAPMTLAQYKQSYDSFGPQAGGRWSDEQIFNAAQWAQQNPMTGDGRLYRGRPAPAQGDATGTAPRGASEKPGAVPSHGSLRPEFAAIQGKPPPVQYINSPQPGAGNWMNDPNQRAAVGMGSGRIRPGELIM